jgi:hypothetical protein
MSLWLTSFEQVASVDEEVERVFLGELDALSNDIVEMVSCQVIWHKVPTDIVSKQMISESIRTKLKRKSYSLSLVNVRKLRRFGFLTNHWDAVRISFSNAVSLIFPLFYQCLY